MKKSFSIYILGNRLFSSSQKAFTIEDTKKLGEKTDNQVFYSEFEALYLVETYNAKIIKNNKILGKNTIINQFSKKYKDFYSKYLVFLELRKKGYIVKAGLKFGGDFRVYEKNKEHAKYITYILSSEKLELKEFIAKVRVSHSTGKKLLLALVDKEDDCSFYEVDWVKI